MALSDRKKIQTLINRTADAMSRIRDDVAVLEDYKARYVASGADPTGTPLEGNVTALNTALASLRIEVDSVVWSTLIAAKVDTHRGQAL